MVGSWSAGFTPIVEEIGRTLNCTVSTYDQHDPDSRHAVDVGVGEFGVYWDYDVTNDNNPYVKIAKWIAQRWVDLPAYHGLRWYVGTMASIHNAQRDAVGQWRPIASQQRGGLKDGQTSGHHDHVHLSVPPGWGGF